MTVAADQYRAADPWARYSPDDSLPWNLARVVHLHRRAGFGATWSELQRDLQSGPVASIDRVLQGKACCEGVPANFEETANLLAETATRNSGRLKAWWMYRMLFGSNPLVEQLTLLWHNHFATSNAKINNGLVMRRQNELFRKLGRAPFGELLDAAVRDPALLLWLDAPSNRKGHPNENLARELMELFTLGIENYSEKDVKEGARALTGWTIKGSRSRGYDGFEEDTSAHDAGEKFILGRRGKWKGEDFIRILLEHPATSRRIAWRLCGLFFGEGVVDANAREALASGLRQHGLRIEWAIETILRSRAFHSDANLRCRVLDPVALVVGSARILELFSTPPSTLLLADWAGRLGQDLFYPPNVGGWAGSRSWISTRTMIGRANFAAELVNGKLSRTQMPFDALGLARKHGRGKDLATLTTFYAELVFGTSPSSDWQSRIRTALGSKPKLDAETARRIVILTLGSPDAQLA